MKLDHNILWMKTFWWNSNFMSVDVVQKICPEIAPYKSEWNTQEKEVHEEVYEVKKQKLRENNIFSISPSLPPLFARLVMAASGLNFFNGIGTNGRELNWRQSQLGFHHINRSMQLWTQNDLLFYFYLFTFWETVKQNLKMKNWSSKWTVIVVECRLVWGTWIGSFWVWGWRVHQSVFFFFSISHQIVSSENCDCEILFSKCHLLKYVLSPVSF
jgi:hypothetical protein